MVTITALSAMKTGLEIDGPQRMISNDFGDLLSFPLALQLKQNFHFHHKDKCPYFRGICCEYSGSPEEELFTFFFTFFYIS